MKRPTIAPVLLCVIATVGLAGPSFAGCDQAQAVDKMSKLSMALGERAAATETEDESNKMVAAYEKINQAADALAQGDNDKACEIYDDVAKEYGISL